MVKSMTGFGHAEAVSEKRKLTVEMKSVNNRYLDVNIRMPKKFSAFEAQIRNVLKEYVSRGKVDVFISEETFAEGAGAVARVAEIVEDGARAGGQLLLALGDAGLTALDGLVAADRGVAGVRAGEQARPGRGAHGHAGVALREAQAAAGQRVDVGGFDELLPIAAEVAPAQVVRQDEDDVGRRGGFLDGA